MKRFQYILIYLMLSGMMVSHAQEKMRVLPGNVNQPSINLYAPAISGDGKTLMFLSDYSDDGEHIMYYTNKKSVSSWNDPIEVSKVVNRPTLNYRGGYCLSFDGDMLIFTSRKSGLGGFELWYSKRQGNNWGAPANFGKPINSASNEGTPSISQDGEVLYFMRCNQMTEKKGANGCTLYYSKKKYNRWQEPIALPDNINTGNSQNPKILADNETLIFSSDQFGGKGGLDLYMTRKIGDDWSDPIPMNFLNTEKDNQFVSVASKGRYAYTSKNTGRENQLVQLLIPEEFKPKGVMRIKGNVVDQLSGEPINAKLTVFNVSLRDRIWNENIGDKGEFTLALNEGSIYDLSLVSNDPKYIYYAKIYDLEKIGRRDRESLNIELAPLELNRSYPTAIVFEPYSSQISDGSTYELRRLTSMLKKNPEMTIEIVANQKNYQEDSLPSSPDLTEIIIDSTYVEKVMPTRDSVLNELTLDLEYPMDTAMLEAVENKSSVSLRIISDLEESIEEDDYSPLKEFLIELGFIESNIAFGDEGIISSEGSTVEELVISNTYHNDRTEKQAKAIREYLMSKGINEERITTRGIKTRSEDASEESQKSSEQVLMKITNL